MQKIIKKIRIFLWLILAVIIGWFGYMRIAPTGNISYINNFEKPNFFIGKLSPEARVITSQGSAEIKGDPVYFSLTTPRRFERAKVTIKFKNTTDFPVMEIGLLNDKIAWGYDLKPLQNKIIDQLALVWPVVYGSTGARLIQRDKKYMTIEEFLDNPPPRNEIALYDYSLNDQFLLKQYAPTAETRLIDYSFRGSYQFYTYIKNEDLGYIFDFIDLNINKDNDPVDIKVYSSAGLIYAKHIADDAAASPERRVDFRVPDLAEGVYRISFIANDDIVTKTITTSQSQFALINKFWLNSGNKTNSVFFTNSRLVSAQTVNPASLGKIKVGDDEINLNGTFKQFSLKLDDQLNADESDLVEGKNSRENIQLFNWVKIELAKDDIIISGDGVFGLNQAGLFDPRFKNIDKTTEIDRERINYVLTNYRASNESGRWTTVTADFDLTKGYQENGKYQFLISVPGLKAEEENQGAVLIKEIKIDLSGTGLWKKINNLFGK